MRWPRAQRLFPWIAITACGDAAHPIELAIPSESICDVRFTSPTSWCGGDPSGEWAFLSTCHRPLLEHLVASCPEGSFVMRPGRMSGQLSLSPSRIDAQYRHDATMRVELSLDDRCIEIIGCPVSYMRDRIYWDEITALECHGHLEVRADIGSDGGGIVIEENRIRYEHLVEHEGEFCVEGDYLFLNAMLPEHYPEEAQYYVLKRM